MHLQLMYRKQYSALPGLQEPRIIQYLLTKGRSNKSALYGVQITQVSRHGVENGMYYPLSSSRSEAERVATYLYENAVSPAQCAEIVKDLRTALALTGGNQNGVSQPDSALSCG